MNERYTIFRSYQRRDIPSGEIVKTNVTLAQAQAHCQSDDASSVTCTSAAGKRRTEQYGSWRDSYRQGD